MQKSIKKNTIFNAIKTCSSIVFPLITFPYISRVLLPENVGKVNFAQSFTNYFALLAALGITTYAIRECAAVKEDKNQLGKVSSQLFSINIITTLVSYAILCFTLIFFRNLDNYRTLIIIESTMIVFTTLGADWLNSAMEDFKYITIRTVIFQIIALILMFLFVKAPEDYLNYAMVSVFSTSGANVVNIWYSRKYCKVRFTLQINWKQHFTPILLLFVMTLSQTIFNNADITMLGLMKSDYEVGLYSTALKIVRIISQVVQSIIYVIMPRLSLYFANNDYNNANRLLRKLLSFNIAVGLPCVTGIWMLAKDIVYMVGGTEYLAAAPIIRILILSFMFSLVGGSFLGNAILIPMKNEKYYMIVCLITAGVNVCLNALLIPQMGAIGASIATAFNGLLIFVLLSLKIDHHIKIINKLQIFVGPIIGCMAIAACCYGGSYISNIGIRILTSIFSSAAVYVVILLVTKNDLAIETLMSIRKRILYKCKERRK